MLRLLKIILTIAVLAVGIPGFLWGCGFIVFAGTISSMVEPETISHTDGIIVLTGGSTRVSRGLDLLAEGKAENLLISGVHKDVKLNELLSIWGGKLPVLDCCITLGREAANTIGNALESQKWVQETTATSIRVITANYHMPRALLELRHTLPGIEIVPHPIIPDNLSPRQEEFWKLAFIEYHKYLITMLRVHFFPSDTSPLPQALIK